MSSLVLVNMADLGDDPEIYGDVLAANDLMRTTTHLVVSVTGHLEHRHRLGTKCARRKQSHLIVATWQQNL